MRRSELFVKTRREAPADETAKNAQLLIRAGYIHKDAAGVYALLPMGLQVVENIKKVIREEMNTVGGQELLMTTLQRKELWESTDRWDDAIVDIWFKSKLRSGTEVGLAWSHEEQISEMMKEFISSYRDLPANVYQFQIKLRNEIRAKSGIMRCREFIMKDLYSYSRTAEEHDAFYEKISASYMKIYERLGLGGITYRTFASGGAFAKFSHEFQTVTDAGEDVIFLDKGKGIAVNQEVVSDDVLEQLGLERSNLEEVKAAEVGNIFSFGTSKSEQLGLNYTDENGTENPVVLGSYGIGVTRLVGVLTEHFADDKGLVWPANIAPFDVYLARLGDAQTTTEAADKAYKELTAAGVKVLYDDRSDVSAGEMFADADLMGLPIRLIVSQKTVQQNSAEVKKRISDQTELVALDKLTETIAKP